jgi:hypothetical protein
MQQIRNAFFIIRSFIHNIQRWSSSFGSGRYELWKRGENEGDRAGIYQPGLISRSSIKAGWHKLLIPSHHVILQKKRSDRAGIYQRSFDFAKAQSKQVGINFSSHRTT